MEARDLIDKLKKISRRDRAKNLSRFFKTGKGEYGEGDRFLGVMVPQTREIIKKFSGLPQKEILNLLESEYHEVRLAAVLILVKKFETSRRDSERKEIFNFYLRNSKYINNWDLVDLSAHQIVGGYLFDRDKKILEKLARAKNIWERRIAVIATFHFIKNRRHKESFKIASMLLCDRHDLIHKAVGWMLREIGKRCGEDILRKYLNKNVNKMPRTTLRYAIERLPSKERKKYLNMR